MKSSVRLLTLSFGTTGCVSTLPLFLKLIKIYYMLLLVINDSPNKTGRKPPFVIGEKVNGTPCTCGCASYDLVEYPNECYGMFRFAPTSDIDETTFERNYNKELV